MEKNPFNLQFGKKPQQFLARDEIVSAFLNSLENSSDYIRESLIVGIRGIGKTSLLNDIAEEVTSYKNWIVVKVFASENTFSDIVDLLKYEYLKRFPKSKITGLSIAALSVGISAQREIKEAAFGLSTQFRSLIESFEKKNLGILFLMDELINLPQIRDFLSNYQLLMNENKNIALLAAGLPQNITEILNNKVLTFLRRANRFELPSINLEVVYKSYLDIFSNYIEDEEILLEVTQISEGYPYLYQLLGHYLWEGMKNNLVTQETFNYSVSSAKYDMFTKVHQLMYDELSPTDKEYYAAMAKLPQPTKTGDIAELIGKTAGYASQYRNRLLHLGLVKVVSYGYLDFSVPFAKEFLMEQI